MSCYADMLTQSDVRSSEEEFVDWCNEWDLDPADPESSNLYDEAPLGRWGRGAPTLQLLTRDGQCHDGDDVHGWCCAPAEPGSNFCHLHAEWGQS